MRESSLESSSFALEAVCSGVIEAIFSKALGAAAAGAGALEAAAAAVATAVARVTRLCLGLLRPLGVLMVLNLRFSR